MKHYRIFTEDSAGEMSELLTGLGQLHGRLKVEAMNTLTFESDDDGDGFQERVIQIIVMVSWEEEEGR